MIRDFLRRVFALVKKEFITIWKDPKSRGIIVLFQGLLKLRILRAKPIKCPRIRVLTVHFSQYFSLSKCTQKPIK